MYTLTLTQPDDWHLHLRDGDYLNRTVPDAAERFARAIIMPNLKPPITTVTEAEAYRARILAAVPADYKFEPLMTLYLTPQTTPRMIQAAKASGIVVAAKLYPAGATTHSAAGIREIKQLYPVLTAMETHDLPLLLHGEVVDPTVDIFEREKYFLERELAPLLNHFPGLRMVLEHISTRTAVDFVRAAPAQLAATITAHHLLLNRNQLLSGGIRPHFYCLPIVKTADDQTALLTAAASGNPKFFLGTDSAPHARHAKETVCGCAGIYTAHAALELYAEAFEQADALANLEAFASLHGADFYRLPRNTRKITLAKTAWQVANTLPFGAEQLVPLRAGETIAWKITHSS